MQNLNVNPDTTEFYKGIPAVINEENNDSEFSRHFPKEKIYILTGTPPKEIQGIKNTVRRFEHLGYSPVNLNQISFKRSLNPQEPLIKVAGEIPFNFCDKHMHISQEDALKLYGTKTTFPTEGKALIQPGQYAILDLERPTIITPNGAEIRHCAIVGPTRNSSQIELPEELIDKYRLEGIFYRDSGDTKDAPIYTVKGPHGETQMPVICAIDHLHISQKLEDKLTDGEKVLVRFTHPETGVNYVFPNVKTRTGGKEEVHINSNKELFQTLPRGLENTCEVFKYNLR